MSYLHKKSHNNLLNQKINNLYFEVKNPYGHVDAATVKMITHQAHGFQINSALFCFVYSHKLFTDHELYKTYKTNFN